MNIDDLEIKGDEMAEVKVVHTRTGKQLIVADWYFKKYQDKYELVIDEPEPEVYICPKCDKEYKTEKAFNKHVKGCE